MSVSNNPVYYGKRSFGAVTALAPNLTGGTSGFIGLNPNLSSLTSVDGILLPNDSGDTFATLAGIETLSNKTLTTPHISTILNGAGTLTIPTSTDTIVGRSTTDTLTNKTLQVNGTTVCQYGNLAMFGIAVEVATKNINDTTGQTCTIASTLYGNFTSFYNLTTTSLSTITIPAGTYEIEYFLIITTVNATSYGGYQSWISLGSNSIRTAGPVCMGITGNSYGTLSSKSIFTVASQTTIWLQCSLTPDQFGVGSSGLANFCGGSILLKQLLTPS